MPEQLSLFDLDKYETPAPAAAAAPVKYTIVMTRAGTGVDYVLVGWDADSLPIWRTRRGTRRPRLYTNIHTANRALDAVELTDDVTRVRVEVVEVWK